MDWGDIYLASKTHLHMYIFKDHLSMPKIKLLTSLKNLWSVPFDLVDRRISPYTYASASPEELTGAPGMS